MSLIQGENDAGLLAGVSVIEIENIKTIEVTFIVLYTVFLKLSRCFLPPSLGNLSRL